MTTEYDWDDWLEKLADAVNLTPWEEEFTESLRDQRSNNRPLSDRQVEILERIYAQRTS